MDISMCASMCVHINVCVLWLDGMAAVEEVDRVGYHKK